MESLDFRPESVGYHLSGSPALRPEILGSNARQQNQEQTEAEFLPRNSKAAFPSIRCLLDI